MINNQMFFEGKYNFNPFANKDNNKEFKELVPPAKIKHNIIIENQEVPYEIKYSARRRTLTLTIDKRGLIAHAPMKLKFSVISNFICEKSQWIIPRLAEYQKQDNKNTDEIYVCGQLFKIRSSDASQEKIINPLDFVNKIFWVDKNLSLPEQKKAIKEIISNLAKSEINRRLPFYAGRMNKSTPQFKISNAESRWGSCSRTQGLTFSWKLGCIFPMLIDYIIVHELAHLTHMNHSPKFWQLVAKHYPAWKQARAQLREFEIKLDGWRP